MAVTKLKSVLSDIRDENLPTLEQLYNIQKENAPSNVYLPYADNIYDIDLTTRTINGPEMISVQKDHRSTVIYFKVDRFVDFMDLANTVCVIEYIIPGDITRVPYLYAVPFYDIIKYSAEDKIIFPWNVSGAATLKSGKIEYAIRFFKIDENGGKLIYNLNTLPTSSSVLSNIEGNSELINTEYDIPVEAYESLIWQVTNNRTYWTIL